MLEGLPPLEMDVLPGSQWILVEELLLLEARNELAAWKMRSQAQPVAGLTGWPVNVVIPVRRESEEKT